LGITLSTLHKLQETALRNVDMPSRFPEALRLMAIGIILVWIAHRLALIFDLCRRRTDSTRKDASRCGYSFSWSLTIVVALSLLMIGIVVISGLAYVIRH
jgi:hypothetical protein